MKRYKIIHQRPEISAEESAKKADFDELLTAFQHRSGGNVVGWRIARSIVVFVAVLGLVFYAINKNAYQVDDTGAYVSGEEVTGSAPEIQQKDFKEEALEPESSITSTIKVEDVPKRQEPEIVERPPVKEQAEVKPNDTSGFVEAEPIDGFPALYQYFDENLQYPTDLLD